MTLRRTVGCSLAALALVMAALVWARHERDWVTVRRGDMSLGVDITGSLRAVRTSQLTPPQVSRMWEFKITMMAPEGGKVKAGQPVLGFDTTQLRRERDQKIAERDAAATSLAKRTQELELEQHNLRLRLAEARGALEKAGLKLERPAELVADLEARVAGLEQERSEREVAYLEQKLALSSRAGAAELAALTQRERHAAQRVREIDGAIGRLTVTAPRDGTVIYTASRWREEKKKVGDSAWLAESILEIPDLTEMAARGEADEADAGRLAVGQSVRLRLDALADDELTGTVSAVSPTVERRPSREGAKIVRLDITLDVSDAERMRPGMRFSGKVETGRAEGVLLIPLEAVVPTAAGPVVYRRTPLGAAATPVRLGRRGGEQVEVLEGLQEGEEVSRLGATT